MRRLLTLKDLKRWPGMYDPKVLAQHINFRCEIPGNAKELVMVLCTDEKIRKKDEINIKKEWGEECARNINT